jgi:hypothetical protein
MALSIFFLLLVFEKGHLNLMREQKRFSRQKHFCFLLNFKEKNFPTFRHFFLEGGVFFLV